MTQLDQIWYQGKENSEKNKNQEKYEKWSHRINLHINVPKRRHSKTFNISIDNNRSTMNLYF